MDAFETLATVEAQATKLYTFLETWDINYKDELEKIDLFKVELTKYWTLKQKQLFTKIFYHVRGHFHEFLWHMGNHAPNAQTKQMILENICEEFSLKGRSHEQLYFDFSESIGVNLNEEILTEEYYLPFVRQFNKGHTEWLRSHSWEDNLIVFSAYERLDNLDYLNLYNLAEAFKLTKKELMFFTVHKYVKHFDNTLNELQEVWIKNPKQVKNGFAFIANHQLVMWKNLSDEIFN